MTTPPELRLKRFLHFASEEAVYEPGDRFVRDSFTLNNLTAIDCLVADGKQKEVTNIILKAYSSGYSVHPEAILFALAVAARQQASEELRTSSYKALRSICKTPEDLLLFMKFINSLAPGKSKGVGNGLKKVLNEWYLSKDPLELAKIVIECPSKRGWTHCDVLKLSHMTSDKIAMQAVLKYMRRGFKEMKEEFANKPEAHKVISHIQLVHDFKRTEPRQFETAARLIEAHNLKMNHVTTVMATSKYIWTVLVPKLPLPSLLNSIVRLGFMRFLNQNHPIARQVITALTNQESIAKSNLHPVDVLVMSSLYENIKVPKPDVVSRTPNHQHPERQEPIAVNPLVVEALNQLMVSTFKLLVPTGQRYMVIVDCRKDMSKTTCYRNNQIKSLTAASLLALGLVKTERSVMVGTYGNAGSILTVRIGKNATLKDATEKFAAVESSPVDLSQPINYAKNKAKEFDVFLMITDNQVQQVNLMSPAKAIHQYRKKMKIPNAKVIVCALCSNKSIGIAHPEDPGMLEIIGFDGKVPRIIEAFSRGAF